MEFNVDPNQPLIDQIQADIDATLDQRAELLANGTNTSPDHVGAILTVNETLRQLGGRLQAYAAYLRKLASYRRNLDQRSALNLPIPDPPAPPEGFAPIPEPPTPENPQYPSGVGEYMGQGKFRSFPGDPNPDGEIVPENGVLYRKFVVAGPFGKWEWYERAS